MFAIAAGLMLAQQSAAPTAAATPPAPPACASEAHAAFDFWVGGWDVYRNGGDKIVAHSTIERLYAGCAIRENWMPVNGRGDGGSLSSYDPASGRWHQTWVGSGGGHVEFDGGSSEGRMVLTGWWPGAGPNGEDALIRMTYSRLDDGAVRQFGEFSADHGLTWAGSFDFVYRRRAGTAD